MRLLPLGRVLLPALLIAAFGGERGPSDPEAFRAAMVGEYPLEMVNDDSVPAQVGEVTFTGGTLNLYADSTYWDVIEFHDPTDDEPLSSSETGFWNVASNRLTINPIGSKLIDTVQVTGAQRILTLHFRDQVSVYQR